MMIKAESSNSDNAKYGWKKMRDIKSPQVGLQITQL